MRPPLPHHLAVLETVNDQVTEKVGVDGNVLSFSVLRVSAMKENPLDVAL